MPKKIFKVFWFILVVSVPTICIYIYDLLYKMRPLYKTLYSIFQRLPVFMLLFILFVIFIGIKFKIVSGVFALPLGQILSFVFYTFILKPVTGGSSTGFDWSGNPLFYGLLYVLPITIITTIIATILLARKYNRSTVISEISFPPDEEETIENHEQDTV